VVARSIYSAAKQTCSRSKARVSPCVARCSNFAPSIHGNCHRQNIDATVVIRKIEKFVLGLPRLFPLEPDLIRLAKNSSGSRR
jgi:hypothetical protein